MKLLTFSSFVFANLAAVLDLHLRSENTWANQTADTHLPDCGNSLLTHTPVNLTGEQVNEAERY